MGRAENIIIFSGTTEGRELSDRLCAAGIQHYVSVATEYGSNMMQPDRMRVVHVGRMDSAQMREYLKTCAFSEGDKIVDATHPYATEVSSNIRTAAESIGAEYIRVLRRKSETAGEEIRGYEDIVSCAAAVQNLAGNILLTTGSKELPIYCGAVSDETLKRTYVRVLPSKESLEICADCGIDPAHIIAMHGPFSTELNLELLKQYDIAHLITKESGTQGGFEEKKEAARRYGTLCHVIVRPVTEEGCELGEVYRMLSGRDWDKKELKYIRLIGAGMGSSATMTAEAKEALWQADIVFGASRLIRDIQKPLKYPMYLAKDIIPVLESRTDIESCVILFSGDSGFYSGAANMHEALKKRFPDTEIRILPGISSIAYLAAALGVSYDDALIRSLHGKNSEADMEALIAGIRENRKCFVLLSGAGDAERLYKRICDEGMDVHIIAGCDLSYEHERICSVEELPEDAELITLMIENRKPERRRIYKMFRDEELIRGKVPMTKACIRHESILRLGLKEGDVLYDIGGGTGSVSLEAAAQHPSIRVYTIEKKAEACELIRENLHRSGFTNVILKEGDAAELTEELEKPDCVFIGGSGGRLREIIERVGEKGRDIRVVVNAISLETMEELMGILKEKNITAEEIVQIAVSDIRQVGGYHIPQAHNPVTIVSFRL